MFVLVCNVKLKVYTFERNITINVVFLNILDIPYKIIIIFINITIVIVSRVPLPKDIKGLCY